MADELKRFLEECFKDDEGAAELILKELKKVYVHSYSDLTYLKEDELNVSESLNGIRIRKLIDFVKNPDRKLLKQVLMEIFVGISEKRLEEIEQNLRTKGILTGQDLRFTNPYKINSDGFLTDVELMKITGFIKQFNEDLYEDVAKERAHQFDIGVKRETVFIDMKGKELQMLFDERSKVDDLYGDFERKKLVCKMSVNAKSDVYGIKLPFLNPIGLTKATEGKEGNFLQEEIDKSLEEMQRMKALLDEQISEAFASLKTGEDRLKLK